MSQHKSEIADMLQRAAKKAVVFYHNTNDGKTDHSDDITVDDCDVVWFSKVLDHWKALVIVPNAEYIYYVVTHDGVNENTYVSHFKEYQKVSFPDSDLI